MTEFEDLTYERDDGVGVLTLARPDVLNAFRDQTQREFIAALAEAESDPATRCLVITGTGRSFCSGADLKDSPKDEAERTGPTRARAKGAQRR